MPTYQTFVYFLAYIPVVYLDSDINKFNNFFFHFPFINYFEMIVYLVLSTFDIRATFITVSMSAQLN